MTITQPAATRPSTGLPRHMPALDGLRGLGMIAVFAAHLVEYAGLSGGTLDNALLKAVLRGGYAVMMFFVFSGFLITGILLDSKEKPRYFRNFYARRTLRIFPLYFAFIALVFLVVPAVFTVSSYYRTQVHEQAWYWTYLTNIGVAIHGWAPKYQYFGHLWTLALEEQFYLVWPLVVLLLNKRWLWRVCLFMLVAGLATRIGFMYAHNEAAVDVLLPSNLDSLGMGGLLALWARSGRPFPLKAMKWGAIASPFAFASLSVWPVLLPFTSEVMWALTPTIVAGGFACLVPLCIFADPRSRLSRVVCWKPAIEAGLVSYAFYVFHQPLLFLVVRAWHLDAQDFPAIAGSHVIGLVVVGVVAGGITAALSVASWRWFEQPVLRLKARFA